MHPSDRPKAERERGGYRKNPNDLISAREATLLIDHRVSVLIAHWEDQRRKRQWHRRAWRLLTTPIGFRWRSRPTQSEEVVG